MSPIQQRRYLFFSASPHAVPDGFAPFGPYAFRELGAADFCSDSVFQEKGRAGRFKARLGEGHRCFGFVADGRTAAYLWLTCNGPAPLAFGLTLTLAERSAYVWDCRTDVAHARRGLYREGLLRMRALAQADAVWISCERSNAPSRAGILGSGFDERFGLDLTRAWRWRRIGRIGGEAAWRRPGATLALASLAEGRLD